MSVQSQLTRIANAVSSIKSELTKRGVTFSSSDKIDSISSKISGSNLINGESLLLSDNPDVRDAAWLEYYKYLYFTIEDVSGSSNTITLTLPSSLNTSYVLYVSYSTNGGTSWTKVSNSTSNKTVTINLSAYQKAILKGSANTYCRGTTTGYYNTIRSTGDFKVYGNMLSLFYVDDFADKTQFTNSNHTDNCRYFFKDCTTLTDASGLVLPATTLTQYCYSEMFGGCTSLINSPKILPATTLSLGCYYSMFSGCTSLTSTPELQATTLTDDCYHEMFRECTSLTTVPSNYLPVTTLYSGCYLGMFSGCSSLTTIPELPATALAAYCYQSMFRNCTSLTTAPVLPATTLATYCYAYMFNGCTSLTTAPDLPAITLSNNCYRYMFLDCTNLNYIKAMFTTTPSTTYTNGWVSGVAAAGTFVKNSAATWTETGNNGIPTNWTVQTASS